MVLAHLLLAAFASTAAPLSDARVAAADAWVRSTDPRFCAGTEPARSSFAILQEEMRVGSRLAPTDPLPAARVGLGNWLTLDNRPIDPRLRELLAARLTAALAGKRADGTPPPPRRQWSGFGGCTHLFLSEPLSAGDVAFIVVERDPGGTGGTGELIALKRHGRAWHVIATRFLWIV